MSSGSFRAAAAAASLIALRFVEAQAPLACLHVAPGIPRLATGVRRHPADPAPARGCATLEGRLDAPGEAVAPLINRWVNRVRCALHGLADHGVGELGLAHAGEDAGMAWLLPAPPSP